MRITVGMHVCVCLRRWVWVAVGVLLGASLLLTALQAFMLTVMDGTCVVLPRVYCTTHVYRCMQYTPASLYCGALQACMLTVMGGT